MARSRNRELLNSGSLPWLQEGVTSIEYALLASLIAVAILFGVRAYATNLGQLFNRIAECVNGGGCS